jgi:hypothetical protein
MNSDKIPGVPEGWELVRIGPVSPGEFFVDYDGNAQQYAQGAASIGWVTIIRKIEKPAAYRPFANAEEYLPHWGKPVAHRDCVGFDSIISTSALGVYIAQGRTVQFFTLDEAFEVLKFADGTPFGVRIDE